jgi:hypothetical protein
MNLFDRRLIAIGVSAAAMTLLSTGLYVRAQESGTSRTQAKSSAAKKADSSRRVPRYFGDLGLSDTQRERIYRIQARHQPKIDDLEKQLEDARAALIKDCEKELTASQKTALERRRKEASDKRKAAAKEMEK